MRLSPMYRIHLWLDYHKRWMHPLALGLMLLLALILLGGCSALKEPDRSQGVAAQPNGSTSVSIVVDSTRRAVCYFRAGFEGIHCLPLDSTLRTRP